jgi:hypothetical protein
MGAHDGRWNLRKPMSRAGLAGIRNKESFFDESSIPEMPRCLSETRARVNVLKALIRHPVLARPKRRTDRVSADFGCI